MAENTILSKIKQISASHKVNVFARTLNSKVDLLPLSIKQQKDIIKTSLDLITSPLTFSNVTTDIINNNLTPKTSLTILDKPLLLLALRANSLGTEINIQVEDSSYKYDFATNLAFSNQVNVAELLEPVLMDKIEITLKVPTLDEDFRINAECLKALDSKKTKDDNKLKELVGEIYIYEIIKFISSVKLVDDGKTEDVSFDKLSISQRVETLEALPMGLTNKIIDNIAKIRDVETQPLKAVLDNNITANIQLNSVFFTRE